MSSRNGICKLKTQRSEFVEEKLEGEDTYIPSDNNSDDNGKEFEIKEYSEEENTKK